MINNFSLSTHKLKTIQPYYDLVELGVKNFEVRKNDRPFRVGDIMVLEEYSHSAGYSGRSINTIITYVLDDEEFCKPDFVIIGFNKL